MQKKKQKKGISLIILVITIIIMIILATTIIISLSNNGIIDKAQEAVDKTNEREVQELANTAWARAYSKGVRTKDEYKSYVEEALKNNNINLDEYNIKVTTSGVTVSRKNGEGNTEEDGDNVEEEKEVWVQKADRTVVKGDTVLNIGDYVDYKSNVSGYTDENGWQVLGAENGELLLLSSKYITSGYRLSGRDAYENGITYLNEICAPYGKGTYATGARSITVEDVDRVTGYDEIKYMEETMYEYGNVVTCSYNGTEYPAYSCSNGAAGGTFKTHRIGFYWYDLNNVYHSISDVTANSSGVIEDESGAQAIIKNTFYSYTVTDLKENLYSMLFVDGYDNGYYLASSCVYCQSDGFNYGLFTIRNGSLKFYCSYNSRDYTAGDVDFEGGIRAVVQLSPDVQLKGSSETGWNIQ